MKKYVVTVPIKATQMVLVLAEGHEEAKTKVLRGEIERELSDLRFEEVDSEGAWETIEQPETAKVDLKLSLWSRDKECWEERATGLWDRLSDLEPGSRMEIRTAPRKEIRFGRVEIERRQSDWSAIGQFEAHWDAVEDLCDSLGIPEEDYETVAEGVPRTDSGDPGVERDFEVRAASLAELMVLIDDEEASLLEEEKHAWADFERTYSKKQEPVEENEP